MRIDSSDDECLVSTVFTFHQKKPNNVTRVTENSSPDLGRGGRNFKPKHSFKKLISESTGPTSILANEEFWKSDNLEESDVINETNNEQSTLQATLIAESAYECPIDEGINFCSERTKDFELKDSLVAIARMILHMDRIDQSSAERLLLDGILFDIVRSSNISLEILSPLVDCLIYFGGIKDGSHHHELCYTEIFSMLKFYVKECEGDPLKCDKLWQQWSIIKYLSQLSQDTPIILWKSLLSLHRMVFEICSNGISKDLVREYSLLMLRLSLDKKLSDVCWIDLSDSFKFILNWLDVPRVHLLMEWVSLPEGLGIFEHPDRVVRVAEMMNDTSVIGQLASKIILDSALFPDPKDNNDGRFSDLEMSKGDDYEFIIAFNKILNDVPTKNLTPKDIVDFYPKLCLLRSRMILTLLDREYIKELEGLLTSVSRLRNAIPVSHYPVYVASRNHLSLIEMYLKSYVTVTVRKGGYLRQTSFH